MTSESLYTDMVDSVKSKKVSLPLFNLKGYMVNLLQSIRRDGADLCDV